MLSSTHGAAPQHRHAARAAQGLVREHIDAHGADALRRRSKEPLDTTEIFALLNLPKGTLVPHGSSLVVVGDNLEWQAPPRRYKRPPR